MVDQDDLLKLIASTYDGVGKVEAWPGILQAYANAVGATAGMLRAVDYRSSQVGMFETLGYEESFKNAYKDYFINLDPYRRHFQVATPGEVLLIGELPEAAIRKRTEFYNEYEKPQGLFHGIGGVLMREPPWLIVASFLRKETDGDYTPEETNRMATLFPHLARSIQMHLLLAGSRRAQTLAQVALDQMKLGIILLDSANRVCYLNRSAEALLGLPWGPRIVDRCLIFPTSGQTAVFRKLAAGTIATAQGKGMDPGGRLRCSLPGVPGAGLEFVVTPVPQEASMIEAGGEQACAVVFLSHHGRAPVPWAPLVHTFGLTPAQARLAAHLAGGESLEESARLLEISIHTARTQIKVIFAKTGTRRQGELVALLMRGMLTGLQNKEFNAPG